MPLGNRLKELRAAKGLNQQGLGSLVGASRQTISLIERGDYNPSITLALRIAKVFGTTVDEVFYLTEEDEKGTKQQSDLCPVCDYYTGVCRFGRRGRLLCRHGGKKFT